MKQTYRVISVILVFGAAGQIVNGFAEYISQLDDIIPTGVWATNPSAFEMFGKGLEGIASAAPTLLIAAIFFHMQTLLDAISRYKRSTDTDEYESENK